MTRIQKKNRRGFTLIELMVVVAILAILGVIVMAVGSNVKQKAQISKTRQTLVILQGILDEYEKDIGGQIKDVTGTAIPNGDTTLFVQTLLSFPNSRDAIKKLVNENGGNVVNDGFGKPIHFVFPPTEIKRGFKSDGASGNDPLYSWEP